MARVWVCVIFFIGGVCNVVYGQSYFVQKYTENDGLANTTVSDIAQDSTGRMWFATRSGISVYDGYSWNHHTTETGLKNLACSKLFVDERGVVWALSTLGMTVSFFRDGQWFILPESEARVNGYEASSFIVDYISDSPIVYVAAKEDGIFQFYENSWIHITTDDGLLSNDVKNLCKFQGDILVTLSNGICIIKNHKDVRDITGSLPLPDLPLMGFGTSYNNNNEDEPIFYVAGENWLGMIKDSTFSFLTRDLAFVNKSVSYYWIVKPDEFGGVILANQTQINYINKQQHIMKRLNAKNGLLSTGATSVFVDREKNIWISSPRGVSKIVSMRFSNYTKVIGALADEVSAIAHISPNKYIWGHNEGLSLFDGTFFQLVPFKKKLMDKYPDIRVMDIKVDKNKTVWFAGSRIGVGYLDKKNEIKLLNTTTGSVFSLNFDENNNLYIAATEGLYIYKDKSFHFLGPKGIKNNILRKITVDKNGVLYIASDLYGVCKYADKKWTFFKSDNNSLMDNVYTVYIDSKNRIFAGTLGGLCYVNNNRLEKFQEKSFKINRPVYLIFEDDKNRLWCGTDNGIVRWDGNEVKEFTQEDGFVGRETNRSAGLVDSDGKIWIGSDLGVSCYNEHFDLDASDIVAPLTEILSINVDDDTLDPNIVNKLNYNQNSLMFSFSCLSFIDEKAVRFKIKLEGFDPDWYDLHTYFEHHVRYTNLPPGQYQFKVKACNALGRWSDVKKSEIIIIQMPFWQQWWFYLINFCLLFGAFYLVYDLLTKNKYATYLELEIKNRTHQLQVSEKKYRQLFEENQAIMLFVDPKNERIIDANPAACQYYGYSIFTIRLLRFSDFLVEPKDFNTLKNFNSPSYFVIKQQKATKDIRDVEVYSCPIIDDEKTILFLIIYDTTERTSAENMLRSSEARYRSVIEYSHEGHMILNEQLCFVFLNAKACQILGYHLEELMGRDFRSYLNTKSQKIISDYFSKDDKDLFFNKVHEIEITRKNGERRILELRSSYYDDLKGKMQIAAQILDITERKEAEDKIRSSLKEKEVLLKEIHHRVKNNLQIVSSLLYLQSKGVKNDEALNLLRDSQNRIKSMAMIHERLYQTNNLSSIQVEKYIHSLMDNLFHTFNAEIKNIRLKMDVQNTFLSIERAIPCGLIINELVSNSLKYAFPDKNNGLITITLHVVGTDNSYIKLQVSDNGIGMPESIDHEKISSIGLQLVHNLIMQLDGKIERLPDDGTCFEIIFKA